MSLDQDIAGNHFSNQIRTLAFVAWIFKATRVSERLLRVYGTRSAAILKLVADDFSLAEDFDVETQAIAAEVVYAFENELAQTLTDCLLRRTMVGLNYLRA